MMGRRVPDNTDWSSAVQPGDYWRFEGVWYGETPNGLTANLSGHTVTEHEDGTITVNPSILVNRGRPNAWHGFLTKGVWYQCG